MSDHIAWCKSERSKARAVIDLLTTYCARFKVHEFAGALRDVTAQTVDQNRSLVGHLDAFLMSCEVGEDETAPVFATKRAIGPTMNGRDCEFAHPALASESIAVQA